MEFELEAGNAITISTKSARLQVDPLGQKPESTIHKKTNILVATQARLAKDPGGEVFFIDGAGEFEVSGLSVMGVAVRAHMDEEGQESAVAYRVATHDKYVAVLGHVHPSISDEALEALGRVDVLIVPVGGNGYTLDGVGAAKLVRKIEPKIVIPTHYAMKGVTYEVPQNELEAFTKELGVNEVEETEKLKLKGDVADILRVIRLR